MYGNVVYKIEINYMLPIFVNLILVLLPLWLLVQAFNHSDLISFLQALLS